MKFLENIPKDNQINLLRLFAMQNFDPFYGKIWEKYRLWSYENKKIKKEDIKVFDEKIIIICTNYDDKNLVDLIFDFSLKDKIRITTVPLDWSGNNSDQVIPIKKLENFIESNKN